MNSPCLECTRVKDPQACENKGCKDWQAWFLNRWDAMRENVRKQMDASTTEDIGIPLGGERYAHPHRMRAYLQADPCKRCLCAKDLCHTPCSARMAWVKKHAEVRK